MAFAKSLFSSLFGKLDNQGDAASPAQSSAQAAHADTSFNESNSGEAKLAWLWREYEHSVQSDVKYSKAALTKFLTHFKEVFNDWQGFDEPVLGLAKQPSTPSRQGHSPMARVQAARSFFTSSTRAGCKAGHPQAVLEGLVQALRQLPTDLSQVARKANATVDEMQAAVSMQLLGVLLILTHSQANRQRLLSLGLLNALAHSMKAAISKLNSQAAMIAVQDSLQPVQESQLWFLQSLLGKLVLIVHSYTSRSLRLCSKQSPGPMHHYLAGEPHYCSTGMIQPGSRQEADQMERIVKPLLDNHLQVLLLEQLAALKLLRSRSAMVVGEWEQLSLQCLLGVVSASRPAQGYLQSRDPDKNGLLMLIQGLGWPMAQAQRSIPQTEGEQSAAGTIMIGPGLRTAEDELKAQILTLQVIGAGLKANSNNLQTMCEAGGFKRITQLMQWAAFTFPPVAHQNSHGPTASRSHSQLHRGGSSKGGLNSLAFRSTHTHSARDQASQEYPALSAAQRSSGVASTSQPSKQQQPAQEASPYMQRPQHDSNQHRCGESSQHPQGVQAGSSQQPHGVSVGKHSHHVRLQGLDPSSTHAGQAGGSRSQPDSRELEELFAVLSSWLSLAESRHGLPLWGSLMKQVTSCLLNAFQTSPLLPEPSTLFSNEAAIHTTAVAKLAQDTCTLQHHALKFVAAVLVAEPATLKHLRAEGLWDLAYGQLFFFWGGNDDGVHRHQGPQEPQPAPQDSDRHQDNIALPASVIPEQTAPAAESPRPSQPPADHTAPAPHDEDLSKAGRHHETQNQDVAAAHQAGHVLPEQSVRKTDEMGGGLKMQQLQMLREHVAWVTEAASCLPATDGNEAECKKLLEVLEDWTLDPAVVLVAAPSLGHIVRSKPEPTLAALDTHDAISKLASIIKKQQQQQQQQFPPPKTTGLAEAPASHDTLNSAMWHARCAVLSLLGIYLHASPHVQRLAVRKWNIVPVLIGLLWEQPIQKLALDMIVSLMRVAPVTEDDTLSKEPLFSKYMETLPRALDSWRDTGLTMVTHLLEGVRKVMQYNPALHQELFKKSQCFVQLLNLLNIDYSHEAGSALCEQVLSTVTALMAGNPSMKSEMKRTVGYDTLLNIVVRRTAPKGPSAGVLMQVLHLILEQAYHVDQSMTICNVEAVPLYLHCLRQAAPELQLRGLQVWKKLLQGNMANLSAADRSGVNGDLIAWFAAPDTSSACRENIAEVLQVTGAYSVSGRDLRALLSLLKRQGSAPSTPTPPHASLLLHTLCTMAQYEGPSAFFDFANESAGILPTTPLQLPTSKGYSFATWLRIEEGSGHPSGTAGRALYALLHRSADIRGVIASFTGNRVVVRCMAPKLTEVALPFQFQPNKWYHVVITHSTGSALSSSVVRMFVDANLEASSRFKYAKIAEPINACSFAAGLSSRESGVGSAFGAFRGQMGCLYLFDDVLNPGQVAALHALGPNYQSIFAPTDSNPLLDQAPAAATLLIHSKEALGSRLVLSYNAQAAAGRMLYNTTDMDGAADVEHQTAAVQEGSQLCCTCHLRDLLHCLGGVTVLLPLVAQLDSAAPAAGSAGIEEPTNMVDVAELMAAVLEDSPSNRLTMLQTSGMALLGYLLQHCSPTHLNASLLRALESLLRAVAPSEALTKQLLQQLLLNLRLWSSAPPAGQMSLQGLILKLAKNEPAFFRELLPIPHILAGVRAHFWETPSPDSLKQAYGGLLTLDELRGVRRGLLQVVLVFMQASAGQQNSLGIDDVQAVVSFVGDCPDSELLQDILEIICSLLDPREPTQRPMLARLGELGGVQLFMSLVQREQQSLRVQGLRILAAFVPFPTQPTPPLGPRGTDGSEDFVVVGTNTRALWPALADALLMFPYTRDARLALLNLLCSQQGRVPAGTQGPPLITAAPVMGIMLGLLTGCDDDKERLDTLTTLKRLVVEGPKENLAVITSTPGWQEWLLQLLLDGSPCLATPPRPPSQPQGQPSFPEGALRSDSATHAAWQWAGDECQLIRALLRALHGFCVQHIPHGWTALEQTACHLRLYAARGVVDGHGLLHELMADVIEDVSGQGTAGVSVAADNWLTVSSVTSEVCRDNAIALLGLVNELVGGSLIAPSGLELRPTAAVMQWAELVGSQEVLPQAWASIGIPVSQQAEEVFQLQQQHWRLPNASWSLITLLQKAAATLASLGPQGPGLSRRLTPTPEGGSTKTRATLPLAGTAELSGEGASLNTGLGDGISRLVLRLLLLYVQQSSLQQAKQKVQEALDLLPVLMNTTDTLSRDRVHMLLAALRLMHEQIQQAGNAKRCQLVEAAITHFIKRFRPVLLDNSQQDDAAPVAASQQPVAWQQVRTQTQQFVVRAVQLECKCMQHECSRQASAIQLLESAADRRRMEERRLQHDFWDVAREALGVLCASERSRRAAARVAHDEETQALARQWRRLQRGLTFDRGIWADTDAPQQYRWKLDKSEDSVRRRMKLKRNYHFMQYDDHAKGTPVSSPTHADRGRPDRLLSGVLRMRSRILDEEDPEGFGASPERPSSPVSSPSSPRAPQRAASVEALDMSMPLSSETLPDDDREARAAQSQQEQGQVIFTTACELVTPKHVVPGTLKILQGQLQFTGDLLPEEGLPNSPQEVPATKAKEGRSHKVWPLAQVAELHHARYLLQPRALELFLYNHSSALFSFETPKVMRDVASCVRNITGRIAIMDRKRKLEMAGRLQLRWQRWEMTNYDYLMQLNTLAGRTFNDLNQYPVFPWVLADYTSPSLDLNAPATYRDLSKPVGALNQKRRREFEDRFDSLKEDPDIPPFHYGSHYSSAGTVLFYLIRMEPFTAMNRNLQGGRFDHADRLFSNVAATWDNCLHSSSDVKELTPEFFHQSEFLLNNNNFNLGTQQTGVALGDVVLPPWAHGSPDEFVRLQREALESDYVSEHLHEWVDLIFGFKQRGKEAEEACNVFYYLTYEGAVDLDQIEDPTQLKAVEEQIRNFGQTPSQLFKRRHVKRGPPPPPSARPLLNAPSALEIVTVGQPNPAKHKGNMGIACLEVTEGRVVLINADRALSCHRWVSLRTDAGAFTFTSATPEIAYTVEAESGPPRMLGTPFATEIEARHCFAVLPGGRTVVCCGYWDNSIRCYTTDEGRLLQSLHQHKDVVTCVASGTDSRTVVSGSRDTTLVIWDAVPPPRVGKLKQKGAVSLVLRERPRHVLYGHSDAVACLAVCTDLDLVISASADGSVLFHTLLEGRYVRCLHLPCNAPPKLLAIAPGPGILLAHSWQSLAIHAYTINGRHIVSAEGIEQLNAFAVSADGRFVLTGGAKGVINLRWIHSLQVAHRYETNNETSKHRAVNAVAVTSEDCMVAGCSDGCMLVYAPRTASIQRKFNLGAAPMQTLQTDDPST
ncbi:hypothetical protein WJX77_009077 [Trebouxia sp. C0004]